MSDDVATASPAPLVGRRGPEWRCPVEWSKVREFALAVHDDHAVGDPLPVPPTFPAYALNAFETFYGSAAAGFDMTKALHAEEDYEYARPLRVGDTLVGHSVVTGERYREGRRGGTLRFVDTEALMRDARSGDLVVRARTTMVQTHAAAPAGAAGDPGSGRDGHAAAPRRAPADVLPPPPAFAFGPLTRVDIVRYAGATYDFVPLHHDEEHARAAGYPTVFAHGMLSAGLLASFVTRWAGPDSVRRYAVRMREPVWPGDVLEARGRVVGVREVGGEPLAELDVELRRRAGGAAITGRASVVVPA